VSIADFLPALIGVAIVVLILGIAPLHEYLERRRRRRK
jgi:hypothetical protein